MRNTDPPSKIELQLPVTPLVQELRNLINDTHHGFRQRSMEGEADAIAHALKRAAEAGVPEADRRRLATEQFERLLSIGAERRSRRRKSRRSTPRQINGGRDVKQLEPPKSG